MKRLIFTSLLLVLAGFAQGIFAQTADVFPHRDDEGNWIPWYDPDPAEEMRTRATVDLRFAPYQARMIGPSPSASAATRYGDYGVSYALGLVDVSIPLYEIKSRSLTLPIYLSYDSGGVRVDDVSGPVGLGWTLEAGGVITRTVNGRNDNLGGIGWASRPSGDPTSSDFANTDYLSGLSDGSYDPGADLFSYNFCGRHGSFHVDWSSSTVLPTTATDLDIKITSAGFVITGTDGTKYSFTRQETTSRTLTISSPFLGGGSAPETSPQDVSAVTAWYLTEIAAMDRTDVITFTYEELGTLITLRHFNVRTYHSPTTTRPREATSGWTPRASGAIPRSRT